MTEERPRDPGTRDDVAAARALMSGGDDAGARRALDAVLRRAPSDADALCALGELETRAGRYAEAEAALRRAMGAAPDATGVWEALASLYEAVGAREPLVACLDRLAECRARDGNLAGAAGTLERIVALAPEHGAARHNLAQVRLAMGEARAAATAWRELVAVAPDAGPAWLGLGRALAAVGELDEAEAALQRAVDALPGDADAPAALAAIYLDAGRYDDAAARWREALERDPSHADARLGLARLAEQSADYDAARQWLAPLLALAEPPPSARLAHARLLRVEGQPEASLGVVDTVLASAPPSPLRRRALFQRAQALDELGRYEPAFEAGLEANATAPSGRWSAARAGERIDALVAAYAPDAWGALPDSGLQSTQPVFVVGPPRSGTTLVEQLLARHPEVAATGERNDILWAAASLPDYPAVASRLSAGTLARIGEDYLARCPDEARRAVDKMPVNFLHLGLIHQTFPRAGIIAMRRDPLDVGLSCFLHDFEGPEFGFAERLEDIGAFLRQYDRLMGHWLKMPGLRLLEVAYEALAADPETVMRDVLGFLGLDWHPDCATTSASRGLIRTVSHAQVRGGVHARSIGRHEGYGSRLDPLRRALTDS